MMTATLTRPTASPALSLYQLLDPDVLANPYPLYHRLRSEAPVLWDPYLHAWVVTRYADVYTVLTRFSANRQPTPEQLTALGLDELAPIAKMMTKQVLFIDPPSHGRIRGIASRAFTPRRVEELRTHIQAIVDDLLDAVQERGHLDLIEDFAYPLPAIVMAELIGIPSVDRAQLQTWSVAFAEILGNFQYNPERTAAVLGAVTGLDTYFRDAIKAYRAADAGVIPAGCPMHAHAQQGRDNLISGFIQAEVDGDRMTEDEIVANLTLTLVGGQETTTNLITNGMLVLLRHPDQLAQLLADPSLIPNAIEELLRFEGASHLTARVAPADVELGGKLIRKGQAVIAVVGAANRDPDRFPDPDRFDIHRPDNRHLGFGWGSHFCFGAPLARLEVQIAFETLLRRLLHLRLATDHVTWRSNMGLRGLNALPLRFSNE
jgi:cytochrome P450